MADIINIQSINPSTFEYQTYSNNDIALINSNNIDVTFNPEEDYIEYFVYDLNGNILIENVIGYNGYTLLNNQVNIDPVADLTNTGYEQGEFNVLYNFLKKKLASSPFERYFIDEISTDRTEIRLKSTQILSGEIFGSTTLFVQQIQDSPFDYVDFYLDFGSNQLVIANNALLDNSDPTNISVLIKLYEPLPEDFLLKSECWVVEQVSSPVAYSISILSNLNDIDDNIKLKGPNTNISVLDQINNSTAYTSYNSLVASNNAQNTGSFQYQVNSLLAESGIELNTDYSDYNNFIHFSSARTRLENFYYKLSLLETYQSSASISNSVTTTTYTSASNIIWQAKINEIITNFDGYEYYLYYTSASTAWPKTNSTPPYTNVSTTSNAGLNFLTSQSIVAQEYDDENDNALINTIPEYLREDPANEKYELFVEMVGQHYDNIFVYVQDITNKYNADNRLEYGISKDVVADVLRDMGVKIYQNNFSSDDLYSALLGFTPSGSLFNLPYTTGSLPTPTGWEYINTYITASSTASLEPTEDINKSIYKRIYHNLPYLLKKKGTLAGLKTLISIYGIPDTILQVNEFGGQNEIDENDYDLWFDQFNYAYDAGGSQYVTSSWQVNSLWNVNTPQTLQFRFQTRGIPTDTGYYSQSLWTTDQGALIRLRYTGSGYASGSYSGSIPNPYNEYALLEFIPDNTDLTTSASVYLPFFDGDWWNVMVTANIASSDFVLYAGNKTTPGGNYNTYQFLASSSINGNTGGWENGTISYFPATSNSSFGKMFSGSYQEIRYYNEIITVDPFEDYIMYPYSIDANGVNTAPNTLIFRASLGSELYTSSLSIHPKVTGSWVTTSSFSGNNNSFYLSSTDVFINNREYVYPNQYPAGIKNRVSNKVRQQNIVLPYSGSEEVNLPQNIALSPFISVQQNVPESGSYTPNIDYVEVAFSPQNEINNDIAGQLGYFNIGEYIGDPRQVSSSAETYPELDILRNYYFEKYTGNYNIWDYIRLIKFFDNSLFKMIQDWVPARTSLAAGIVIKQTVLERNKYPVPQPDLSSSLAMVGSNSTSSAILFQTNNDDVSGGLCYPITASGVYNLYLTGSITNTSGDNPTLFDIYITSSAGISSLFSQNINLSATVPFSGSYDAYIPSGSSLCFVPDSLGDFFTNNVTASLLIVNTSTFPYTTQDLLITGSSIQMYEIDGGTGGTMPNLFGLTSSEYTGNNVVNITQSWDGINSTPLGLVPFTDITQTEFYDGELSGSYIQVENGELNEDNPYKMASTQLIAFNTTASTSTTPPSGQINWVSNVGYDVLTDTFYLFVARIHINEVDSNGLNIQTALGNLQAGNKVTFTIGGEILPASSLFTANTFTGIISSVSPTSATTWTINFANANQLVYFANYQPGDTLDAYLISSNVYFDPFLNDSAGFDNSAFNPLIDNAVISRPNPNFYDVDFSTNVVSSSAGVAVNKNVIISASRGSGSATPSTVPQSNYTTLRVANPRYFGCKNTSPGFNLSSGSTLPSVEIDGDYFAYFDWVGGTNYEIINKAGFHIKYLIDFNGNVLTPNLTGSYYYSLTRIFNEQSPANVIFQASQSSGNVSPLQGTRSVIKSGALAQAVIFSQYSSSITAFTLPTMSFSTAVLNTNYALQTEINAVDYTGYGTYYTLDFIQPATSGSTATTASISGDYVALVTSDPEPQLVPKLYLEVNYTEPNYSYPATAYLIIQKSVDNGSNWTTYAQQSNYIVPGNSYNFSLVAPPDTAISGSRYRAQIYYDLIGGFPYAADPHFDVQYGVFYLTTTPPFNSTIPSGSGYWTTGSNSKNVLTGSLFTTDVYGVSRQTTVTASGGYSAGYDAPYQVFTVQVSDEIRFGASENQVYQIIGVNPPGSNANNALYLTLDKQIVTGTNINSFLLRRYVPNPNFVIIDALKTNEVGGGPGFLLPQYTSQQILDNFDNIVANLTEKGLI